MSRSDRRVEAFRTVERRVLDRHLPQRAEHRIDADGGAVRVVDAGDGPPFVFLHGVTGTLTNLVSLAGDLTSTGRCILVDLPGHGLSGPLVPGERSPTDALVDAVVAVLDGLQVAAPAVLVGNSLGGMVALRLAVDRPDRVAALGILGAPGYALPGARARFPLGLLGRRIVGPLVLGSPAPPLPVYARLVRRAFGRGAIATLGRDALDANRRSVRVGRNARSVARLMHTLVGARGSAAPGVALTPDDLERIAAPTWFLLGEADPFQSPASARSSIECLPDSTVDVVDGAHVPWLDAPVLTRRRLRELLDRADAARRSDR